MIHSIRKLGLRVLILITGAATLVIGAATSAAAQGTGTGGVDVTAAYQFQRLSCCGSSTNFPGGFSVDAAGIVMPMLSWVGQIDLSRKSDLGTTETLTSFAGGVRWNASQTSGATPFVQVLIGAAHDSFDYSLLNVSGSSSVTKFLFDIDGGIAIPITDNKKTSVVGEIGYRRIFEDTGLNGIRVVLGVRFNVGS